MSDTSKLSTCQMVCWGLSALTGLIVLWSAAGAIGFFAALLLAVACAAFVGLVFTRLVCIGYQSEDSGIKAEDVKETLRQVTGITGYKAPDVEEDAQSHAASAPAQSARAASAQDTAQGSAAIRTGTLLEGEQEVAGRKGEWRYGETATAPAAPAAKEDAADNTRPEALDAARGGKADDLKQIKGVGPKLEKLCNELGFYHFDQIANWTEAEVAWVDENLSGFKGRVSRDDWVKQAKTLAAGDKTEPSGGARGGDVD